MKRASLMQHMFHEDEGKSASRTSKTLSLSLASMFNTLMALVLSMTLARVLSKVEFAAYSQTFLAYQTLAPFLGLGISEGLYYIYPRNENRKRAVVWECMTALLITGILYALFFLFGGNHLLADRMDNPQVSTLLLYLIPFAVSNVPATIIGAVLINENRVKLNAKYSVVNHTLIAVSAFLAVLLFRSAKAAVLVRSLASSAVSVFMIFAILIYILPKDDKEMKWSSVKQIIAYSLPMGLATMLGTLDANLDKWIVSFLCSPEQYAVFENGAQEVPLIGAITGAISTVIMVDMAKEAKAGRRDKAVGLFRMVGEKTSLLLFPIMVFLMATASPVIEFLFSSKYAESVPVFRVYLLYMPARTVMFFSLLIALGKSKSVLFRSAVCTVADAALSIVLVYLMGPIGGAIASIFVLYCVQIPINCALICKEAGVKVKQLLPFRRYGICLLLSLPGGVLSFLSEHFLAKAGIPVIFRLAADGVLFVAVTAPVFVKYFKLPVKKTVENLLGRFKRKK